MLELCTWILVAVNGFSLGRQQHSNYTGDQIKEVLKLTNSNLVYAYSMSAPHQPYLIGTWGVLLGMHCKVT